MTESFIFIFFIEIKQNILCIKLFQDDAELRQSLKILKQLLLIFLFSDIFVVVITLDKNSFILFVKII
jgi:hypothetical protein